MRGYKQTKIYSLLIFPFSAKCSSDVSFFHSDHILISGGQLEEAATAGLDLKTLIEKLHQLPSLLTPTGDAAAHYNEVTFHRIDFELRGL